MCEFWVAMDFFDLMASFLMCVGWRISIAFVTSAGLSCMLSGRLHFYKTWYLPFFVKFFHLVTDIKQTVSVHLIEK